MLIKKEDRILVTNDDFFEVKWMENSYNGQRFLIGILNKYITAVATQISHPEYEVTDIRMRIRGHKTDGQGKIFSLPLTKISRVDTILGDLHEGLRLTEQEISNLNDAIENMLSMMGKDFINFTKIK